MSAPREQWILRTFGGVALESREYNIPGEIKDMVVVVVIPSP
jgi:hypothetical protein